MVYHDNNAQREQELMDTIQASKGELQDYTDQMSKVKSDITAGQESFSQEVVKKLNKQSYQFESKENKAQYTFNTTIKEHIDAAEKGARKTESH